MSDAETFKLKPLSHDAVERALARAERYRLLNDPEPSESICRDILRLEPENQRALVTIILVMTDQFRRPESGATVKGTREYVARLAGEYERLYYTGIVHEKNARAMLARRMGAAHAYDVFRDAMDWYEKAEPLRSEGNDDAILRWNSCVRTIRRNKLRPIVDDGEIPLE